MIRAFWKRIGRLWCTLMHSAPLWPSHGYYRCSICMRKYPVLWARDDVPAPNQVLFRLRWNVSYRNRQSALAPISFAGPRRRD